MFFGLLILCFFELIINFIFIWGKFDWNDVWYVIIVLGFVFLII